MSEGRPPGSHPAPGVAVLLLALAAPVPAQDGASPPEIRTWVLFRHRLELVEQDGFASDASASTLRAVVGFERPLAWDVSGLAELEIVNQVGNDRYDDTVNGMTQFPVVADPESVEINQLHASRPIGEAASVRVGRQRITLDNHRFVGNVGWRQNEQTFDAVAYTRTIGEVELFYAYLNNANRIFGEDSPAGDAPMDSHLLNASRGLGEAGKLSTYLYYLDFDRAADLALSTATVGARFAGSRPLGDESDLLYTAELAHQSDVGDNPNDVGAGYLLAELGAEVRGVRAKAGLEVLQGSTSPGDAFTTPLATAHAFHGWADKFLATPPAGLEDAYLAVDAPLGEAKLSAVYHDFGAEATGADYGCELDLALVWPLGAGRTLGLKYADYDEDGFSTDTEKLWLWLQVSR